MNAIIVPGFRKSGSTTIFDWLVRSEVAWGNPNAKEPQHFANVMPTPSAELWYDRQYRDAPPRMPRLDGSTLMLSDPNSFRRAVAHYGNVKFLLVVREPAKRAYSAYWHMAGKASPPERRSFAQVLADAPHGQAPRAIYETENEVLHRVAADNLIDGDYLGTNYLRSQMGPSAPDFAAQDAMWPYRYLGESCYSFVLERLLQYVAPEIVRVEVLEHLLISIEAQRALLSWLGHTDSEFPPLQTIGASNQGFDQRGQPWVAAVRSSGILRWLAHQLPKPIKGRMQARMFQRTPELVEEHYKATKDILLHEYETWRRQGLDVDRLWTYKK